MTKDQNKRLNSISQERDIIRGTISSLTRRLNELNKQEKEINDSIETVVDDVTDHAVVRYCERVYSLNLNMIKDEILKDTKDHKLIKGEGKIVTDKITYVIKDNKVITIY